MEDPENLGKGETQERDRKVVNTHRFLSLENTHTHTHAQLIRFQGLSDAQVLRKPSLHYKVHNYTHTGFRVQERGQIAQVGARGDVGVEGGKCVGAPTRPAIIAESQQALKFRVNRPRPRSQPARAAGCVCWLLIFFHGSC